MAASRKGIFARNILSNFAGYGVKAGVALFLWPFVEHVLGGDLWAIWTLVVALTGYYGLLDFGVRSAVGQYVTRYWAQDDMDGVNRTLSTAFVITGVVALAAVLVTLILFWTLPMWLEVPGEPIEPVQWALLIVGFEIAIGLPMALWATVTYARERFDIGNAIAISESFVRLGASYAVLTAGYGIIGLAVATAGTHILSMVVRMVVAFRLMPGIRISLRMFHKSSVRELCGFGFFNLIVNAADKIVLSTDAVIIGAALVQGLVFYQNGAVLIPHITMLVLMVTWTITPYATSCDARGEHEALRKLLLGGTRGSVFLAAVIAAGVLATGDQFLALLIAEENLVPAGEDLASSALILAILTWSTLVRSSSSCGRQILFGMRRIKLLAGLSIVEAILNLGISITLIYTLGLVGVALGTLIPVVLVYFLAQNLLVARLLEVSPATFFVQILRASVPVMAAMLLTSYWLDSWLTVEGWLRFGLEAGLLLVPVVPIGFFFVMNRDERAALLKRLPFGRERSPA